MIQHQLTLAFRNIKRFKSEFLINLVGLSTGLACVILIGLWVNDELEVDKFHENDDRLYQVLSVQNFNSNIVTAKPTTGMLEQTLVEEMPEIEQLAVFQNFGNDVSVAAIDKNVNVKASGKFGSKDFFKVFTFPLITGNKSTVLTNNDAIAISRNLAMRLFNTTNNLVGKTITVDYDLVCTITGVFEDIPHNSTLQFDFILSYEWLKAKYPDSFNNWGNTGPRTFIVLKEQTDITQFKSKIKDFILSRDPNANAQLLIQPFSDTYLYGKYENGQIQAGRMVYVRLFSLIAVFVLIIACINFMNLATANASRRAKEVGIKKAIGSSRRSLIFQYLSESTLLACLSFLVGLLLVFLLLPQFNIITSKQLAMDLEPGLVVGLIGIIILTGLLAGSYPALYLSGFHPVAMLKGKLQSTFGEEWTRKGLVVFQFVVSVVLVVSVIVVKRQIDFIQTKNLGYNQTNVIHFMAEGEIKNNSETFFSEMKQISGVEYVAAIDHSLMGHEHRTSGVNWAGKDESDNTSFEYALVSADLIETLGMEMVVGRPFSTDYGDEQSKIIFNETAIKAMSIDDPVGKLVNQWGTEKEIIGVVKDFHFESLHEQVNPMFLIYDPAGSTDIMARLTPGTEMEAIASIERLYKKLNPGFVFDFNFLDQEYQLLYESEMRISTLSKYFAGLTILVSCLGLLGLAQFTTRRRFKEIGIRKILGASNYGIITLLSGEFMRILVVSILIAVPISYLITNIWLQSYAFKISLDWYIFAGAGAISLFIAWLTIASQTFRTARINPTQCLKEE